MAEQVYFGNVRSAQYIKAPDSGLQASPLGAIDGTIFAGGGSFATNSGATHREYGMNWSIGQIEDFQFLYDYRNGLKGSGLLYWVDPYAAYWNALPPHWADPWLTLDKWPSLTGTALTPTAASGGAQYNVQGIVGAVPDRCVVLLVPNDQQLVIGFSGTANGSVVRAQPYDHSGNALATVDMTLLDPSGNTRYNHAFSGANVGSVKFYITSTVAGGTTITLSAADAIYTAIGAAIPTNTTHKNGRGHTGMRFKSDPTLAYTFFDPDGVVPKRYVSAAATFTEIGAWL